MKTIMYAVFGGGLGFILGFVGFWAWWSVGTGSWIPFRQLDFGIIWPASAGILVGGLGSILTVRYLNQGS